MSFTDFNYFLLLRLAAAALFGGLIGLERGRKKHEAGLRTHILLCLGSAAVMVLSECIVKQYGTGDIMRMGAQVISGIGFLGMGSMITYGNKVRGITTAAGLWATACVGLTVGMGYYILAAATVIIMLFAMFGLSSFSEKLDAHTARCCNIKIDLTSRDAIKELLRTLTNEGVEIDSVKLEENEHDISVIFEIKLQKKGEWEKLMGKVMAIDGVKECITV